MDSPQPQVCSGIVQPTFREFLKSCEVLRRNFPLPKIAFSPSLLGGTTQDSLFVGIWKKPAHQLRTASSKAHSSLNFLGRVLCWSFLVLASDGCWQSLTSLGSQLQTYNFCHFFHMAIFPQFMWVSLQVQIPPHKNTSHQRHQWLSQLST